MIEKSHRGQEMASKIVYSSNPKELIEKVMVLIKKEKSANGNG
jgi:hypothetical protein